jgi:hypothetical protein
MTSTTLVTIIHGAIALAITAGATVLLALHDIDGTTTMALYSTALAAVGAGTSTALALKVPTPEQIGSTPPQV